MASRRGPDNSLRIAVVGTVRGQAAAVVHHVQCVTSSSISQADFDAWLILFAAAWKTRFQTQLPTDFAINYFKAVCYTPGGGELVSTTTPTAWSGTASSVSLSGSSCAVVSWQSGVYWRGGKPRTYLPLFSNGNNSGTDTLTTAFRNSLTTAAVGLKNDVNTITGATFGFVSFQSGNAPRGTPLFFAIVGAVVHPRIGSQRRRLGKWQN